MNKVETVKYNDIIEQLENSAVNMLECRQEPVVLNERYLCCEQIGEGGLSLVYKAKDSYAEYFNDTKNIALKIPISELLKMKDIAAFVYSEYRILSQLQHPYVVKVLDFGISSNDTTPYIIMECLEGRRLDEIPLDDFSREEKMILFERLGDVIGYIHDKGIVHADIAPNNIMILNDGSLRLFDFGISQFEEQDETLHLDFSKMRAFNTRYAAPEILNGENPTRASDIFSFALMMFELLLVEELSDTMKSKIHQKGPGKKELGQLPREIRAWFAAALDPNPSKRNVTRLRRKRRLWFK